MDVCVSLTDLEALHPRLLWPSLAAAAVAVLREQHTEWPVPLVVELRDLPEGGNDRLIVGIDGSAVPIDDVVRVIRTFEAARLTEMAAIAVAGLVLYYGGQREICDVSLRGSAADYLVGDAMNLLEVAGRTIRADLESAWREKLDRLRQRDASEFYVAIVEFETPSARLSYFRR